MKDEINKVITEKINECNGDIDVLQKSLSDYFGVPLEDIHTNIKITIPVPEEMIKKKEKEPINVNLSIKVKDERKEDEEYLDTYDEEDIVIAKEEGVYEGKLEIARCLLDSGMCFEEIIKVTGLDEEDLERL